MSKVSFKIEGWEELKQELMDLPDNVVVNGVRAVLRKGAKKIKAKGSNLVRKETGKLQSLIEEKRPRTKSKFYFKHTIGVPGGKTVKGQKRSGRKDSKGAFYGAFIEFGTSRIPEKSYLRQALEEEAPNIVSELTGNIKKEVNAALTRHNRKIAKKAAQ